MNRPTPRHNAFGRLLMATALCLSFAAPAYAEGKADRARAAIAEAQTKIDTAESLGTSTAQPGRTAEANAALARAKENLAAGHKPEAIADAIHASALADTALGQMQKNAAQHNEAVQAQAQDQANGMARAQMNVDAAHMQTDMANDRANRAENAAAASASDAAISRNAAMAAQAQPMQVQTTTSTEQAEPAAVRRAPAARTHRPVTHHRRVVHHRRVAHHHTARGKVTTTTTVTHTGM
ncbi:hypothetical protein [Novosphingobium sp.]|uniref:hypothetical protein n=1 Tax=Novosphingobium sp. TaxID=1874826 RepID=UPI003BAB35A5